MKIAKPIIKERKAVDSKYRNLSDKDEKGKINPMSSEQQKQFQDELEALTKRNWK